MNIVKLTKESSKSQIKQYFQKISYLVDKGEDFPVDLDEVWKLAYTRKDSCVRILKKKHIQGIDYQVFHQKAENSTGGRPTIIYKLSAACLEYLIAREIKVVFNVYREIFHAVRKGKIGHTSKFVERFHVNSHKIQKGYFSVLGYTFFYLHGGFEKYGYQIPSYSDKGVEIRPDNSIGRLFSDHLKKNYPKYKDSFLFYNHVFPDLNKTVPARQYPIVLIPVFIEFLENIWIPEKAPKYLGDRCPKSLEFLPKLLK